MFGVWLRSELAAGLSAISEVIPPAAGNPDTMHSEVEESKEGMILISLGGRPSSAEECGGRVCSSRRADASFKVSGGDFVRFPCAFAAQFELQMPNPVPSFPSHPTPVQRRWEEASDLAQTAPLKAVF